MDDTNVSLPLLPAHIEETIRSIARLHAEHHQNATPLQRIVDRTTAVLGRPRFIGVLTAIAAAWISLNLLAAALGYRPIDPPPFSGLGSAVSLVSLYLVVVILATQRRENQLAQPREQLTLELAILSEQKTAKVIQLLEEARRDNPLIRRVDQEADAMAQPADPKSVLDAIRETHDVAKAADVEKIFAKTKQAFGRLDILVNNAGVYNSLSPLEEVTEEDFHRHFNINVLGLLLATKEAAKLVGYEGGSVINIGSVASDLNPPNSVVYTATKGAVDAVTRVLAKELGPRKIRVNSIKPGGVETEGTHAAGVIGSDFEKQFIARTPLGRTGQADAIAQVAVFLASEESRWVTGDTMAVSGGVG